MRDYEFYDSFGKYNKESLSEIDYENRKIITVEDILYDENSTLEEMKRNWDLINSRTPIKTVSRKMAKSVNFDPGHPNENVVYVCHPKDKNKYIAVTSFYKKIVDEKFYDTINCLITLGVQELEIEVIQNDGSKFDLNASAEIEKKITTELKISQNKTTNDRRHFKGTYERIEPSFSEANFLWMNKKLRSIAEQRLQYGLLNFEFHEENAESFGFDANLSTKISLLDLSAGGNFEKQSKFSWTIRGTFYKLK
ncbi:hypothetical protein AR454_06625 [Bacillus mycoides]|nr:hypothetical protein [Bacillus mycoides]MCD4646689.1 hypothetical protein [Bacillus mycoides]PHA86060.1 hypothetical protein COE74_16415 [Bacillus toyonensis]